MLDGRRRRGQMAASAGRETRPDAPRLSRPSTAVARIRGSHNRGSRRRPAQSSRRARQDRPSSTHASAGRLGARSLSAALHADETVLRDSFAHQVRGKAADRPPRKWLNRPCLCRCSRVDPVPTQCPNGWKPACGAMRVNAGRRLRSSCKSPLPATRGQRPPLRLICLGD